MFISFIHEQNYNKIPELMSVPAITKGLEMHLVFCKDDKYHPYAYVKIKRFIKNGRRKTAQFKHVEILDRTEEPVDPSLPTRNRIPKMISWKNKEKEKGWQLYYKIPKTKSLIEE